MSKQLPWFRAYTRMVDDDKLKLLAFEDRWHFVALLCLKGEGLLDKGDAPGLLMRKVAVKLGLDVRSLEEVAQRIAPVLRQHGYEFFWRDTEPGLPGIAYAWFIKRDATGRRTHHIHCLEPGSSEWEQLSAAIFFKFEVRARFSTLSDYGSWRSDE